MTDTHAPDAPAVAWECTAAKLPWGPGTRAVVERDQDDERAATRAVAVGVRAIAEHRAIPG
jgi:hypothetical protein